MKLLDKLFYYLILKPLTVVIYFFGAFCAFIVVAFKGGYDWFMSSYKGGILKEEIEE